jgi:hypothetical protein
MLLDMILVTESYVGRTLAEVIGVLVDAAHGGR